TYPRPRCEMTQSNDFSERRFGEMKTVLHDLRSNRSIERLPKGSQNCAGLFRIGEVALVCLESREGRKRVGLEATVARARNNTESNGDHDALSAAVKCADMTVRVFGRPAAHVADTDSVNINGHGIVIVGIERFGDKLTPDLMFNTARTVPQRSVHKMRPPALLPRSTTPGRSRHQTKLRPPAPVPTTRCATLNLGARTL